MDRERERVSSAFEVVEPKSHAVFQSNEKNLADIPIILRFSSPVIGRVEVRLISSSFNTPWSTIGEVDGTEFIGVQNKVPVGQYTLHMRTVFDEADRGDECREIHVDPVFVGDLWILAGQSNMEGCGKLIDMDHAQIGISCYYLDDRWDIASEPLCWLDKSTDEVHWCAPDEERAEVVRLTRRSRTLGSGLGIPFAKELQKTAGVPIGLIMCAEGGTSMAQWSHELRDKGGASLYGAMLRRIRKLGGKVKGCLWYQGEADAFENASVLYYARTKLWIEALRKDAEQPDMPFIFAQLSVNYATSTSPNWNERSWNAIQHEQLRLETEIPYAAVVPLQDLTLSDFIHLDTASLRITGKRMAWQALRLAYGNPLNEGQGPRPGKTIWSTDRTRLRLELFGFNGRLESVEPVRGFHLEAEGTHLVFEACIAPDGGAVEFVFDEPVPAKVNLWHGAGLNPLVNTRDEKD